MAPRPKYTPEIAAAVVRAIELGATYELAAGYAGISADTLSRWRNRYAEFADMLKAAEGRAAVKWLAKIEQAASEGTWQAAAWKLERRYPNQYGRTVTEHQGNDEAPVAVRLVRGG